MADEPINVLSKRLSKFFTNTQSSNFDYERGRERQSVERTFYNSEQKVFKCKCISHRQHSSPGLLGYFFDAFKFNSEEENLKKGKIKIWFIGDDEYMNGSNADPDLTDVEELKNAYTKNAREAVITSKFSNISYGDILSVERRNDNYYVVKHHDDEESIISVTSSDGESAIKTYNDNKSKKNKLRSTEDTYTCIEKSRTTPGSCYQAKPWEFFDHGKKLETNLTLLDFQHLGHYFKDNILEYISRYESGNAQYNANNIGPAGESVDLRQTLGKNLTDMSIAELRANQNDSGGILFATGRYQIVPKTLDIIYRSFDLLQADALGLIKYTPVNQDSFGVFLCIIKQPRLGKFLLGVNNGSTEDLKLAGNDLALEWAAFPFLRAEKVRYGGKDIDVLPGHSPYEGIQGNKTNPKRMKSLMNILNKQRLIISEAAQGPQADTTLIRIIEKYKEEFS